jgi:hypothetical protein
MLVQNSAQKTWDSTWWRGERAVAEFLASVRGETGSNRCQSMLHWARAWPGFTNPVDLICCSLRAKDAFNNGTQGSCRARSPR